MATIRQFYGGAGVPLRIDGDVEGPAMAWGSQRARVRGWLSGLADSDWSGPTRCESWDTTGLVRHLASASQFLGYTLHQAASGEVTRLLQGMDTRTTVEAAASMLGDMTPVAAQETLASADAAVDAELAKMRGTDWGAFAEAPPGQLPAHLVVSHFLFDSWVHEYDLMVPRGEHPAVDPLEAEVVARYLIGLAVVATGSHTPLDLHLSHPELRIGITIVDDMVEVTSGQAPKAASVLEGRVEDVVDRTSGRVAGPVRGDERALAVIDAFGQLLAV